MSLFAGPSVCCDVITPSTSGVVVFRLVCRRRRLNISPIKRCYPLLYPFVSVIALDFSKAFDTVRHSTLLDKIARLPIPDAVYNWLVDYFHGHEHCTTFGGQEIQHAVDKREYHSRICHRACLIRCKCCRSTHYLLWQFYSQICGRHISYHTSKQYPIKRC